ncbi:MAG: hypothetical protein R6V85_06410 [Polyangia bacterium]
MRVATLALPAALIAGTLFAAGIALGLAPTDDAFITYRCARNLAEGHGPVYNPGETVEASSSFLYTLVLGGLAALGIEPPAGALLVGAISLWLTALGMMLHARRVLADRRALRRAWIAIALVAAFTSPALLLYLHVGLETCFYTALLTGAALVLLGGPLDRRRLATAGMLWGLAAATRIEALALLPAAAFPLIGDAGLRRGLRRALPMAIGLLVAFAPPLIFRWAYFGDPLPNTFYAKVHGGGLELRLRGLGYVWEFLSVHPLWIATIAAAGLRLVLDSRQRTRTAFLLAALLCQAGAIVYVGGDFFPFHRFTVPVVPLWAMLYADLALRGIGTGTRAALEDESLSAPRRWVVAAAALLALASSVRAAAQPAQLEFAMVQRVSTAGRAEIGTRLGEILPPGASLLTGTAGAIPYFSRLRSHDLFGLTDPAVARLPIPVGEGMPGHEKWNTYEQIEMRQPDVIVFLEWPLPITSPAETLRKELRARAAFSKNTCPQSPLADYRLMRLRTPHHEAVLGVRAELASSLDSDLEPL